MLKVVDYNLFTSDSAEGLTSAVKSAMKEDWVPSGVVVKFHDKLIQAMVKFADTTS